jgi:alpha-tubulin suppressor-like RCC1 family protein
MQHTVGLKKDGTVVTVGDNKYGQCAISDWTSIGWVNGGWGHTVGVKRDGTVLARGDNSRGQCDVGGWTNITQVATGWEHTMGLKGDATLVVAGNNSYGQANIDGWTDIIEIAAGWQHTVGLKDDGTVVAAGPDVELAKWNLGVVEYALTISGTPGGSVDRPGTGTFSYNAGVMVRLIAEPEAGYRLANWTGDVDTIANVRASTTVIGMYGNYEIAAVFGVNWSLIRGIIGGVMAVSGLTVFVLRKRKSARTKERGRRRAT